MEYIYYSIACAIGVWLAQLVTLGLSKLVQRRNRHVT